jgi:hypothetical protein
MCLDLETLLKHLLWQISLIIVLVAIFHYVLEIIDYNSFLLSIMLIASVLAILITLFTWKTFKKQFLIKNKDGCRMELPCNIQGPEGIIDP